VRQTDSGPDRRRVRPVLDGCGMRARTVDAGENPRDYEFHESIVHRIQLQTGVFTDGTLQLEPSDSQQASR
jgi:hypothetical protein